MNPLLARQLKRLQLDAGAPPGAEAWSALLGKVSNAYDAADNGRYLLERSLRISSDEMRKVYEDLRALSAHRLAAERDRLRVVVDALSEGLLLMDPTGKVLVTNQTAVRLIGVEFHELVGSHGLDGFRFRDLMDGSGIAEHILTMVSGGGIYTDERAVLVRRDGTSLPVSVRVMPAVFDKKVTGSVLVFRDITDQITARNRLVDSEARFRHLFDRSPIASWELDLRATSIWLDSLIEAGVGPLKPFLLENPVRLQELIGTVSVTAANMAAVVMFEVDDLSDLTGSLNTSLFTEATLDSFIDIAEAVAERRLRAGLEMAGQTAKGKRLHALVDYAAMESDGAVDFGRVVMTFADITDRKRDEERMEELIRVKDEFLATVSHELRTPLSAVVASAALLEEGWRDNTYDETAELLGFITRESQELAHIIEDLLVGARADSGRLVVAPETVHVESEVDAVLWVARRPLEGHSVTVDVGDLKVWADAVRLRQILRNLLTNAGRYGGDVVEIRGRSAGETARIEVIDDGPGIQEGEWEAIFEPYHGMIADRGLPGSVGLGLTVSRQLARLMGGDLVYHHGEEGSVFTLTLPETDPATNPE